MISSFIIHFLRWSVEIQAGLGLITVNPGWSSLQCMSVLCGLNIEFISLIKGWIRKEKKVI